MHAPHSFTACRTTSAGAGPLSVPAHARTPVPPRCAPDHGCTHFRSGPATPWVLWDDSWLFEYVLAESVSTVPASSCTPVVTSSWPPRVSSRAFRSRPFSPAPFALITAHPSAPAPTLHVLRAAQAPVHGIRTDLARTVPPPRPEHARRHVPPSCAHVAAAHVSGADWRLRAS